MTELVEIGEWNSSFIKVCYVMDWERKKFSFIQKTNMKKQKMEITELIHAIHMTF